MWGYPGFSMIWEHALGVGRGPEAREHGVQFHGELGVLVVDRAGWEVYPETDRIDKPNRVYKTAGVPRRSVANPDYHLTHVQNFIECMGSRKRPNSDVEIGHNSMIACHLGNMAQRRDRMIHWDVENEKVIGDAEAQAMVMRQYRAPWVLTA
jgi:Oxidoreductase family, C-terminal alpha/beta domain